MPCLSNTAISSIWVVVFLLQDLAKAGVVTVRDEMMKTPPRGRPRQISFSDVDNTFSCQCHDGCDLDASCCDDVEVACVVDPEDVNRPGMGELYCVLQDLQLIINVNCRADNGGSGRRSAS